MSLLTQSLLSRQPDRQRQYSMIRQNTSNLKALRSSGVQFQRYTLKNTIKEGDVRKNVFQSVKVQEMPPEDDIVKEFQKRDRMAESGLSYHSVSQDNDNFSSVQFDGQVFYDAKQSFDRKVSQLSGEDSFVHKDSLYQMRQSFKNMRESTREYKRLPTDLNKLIKKSQSKQKKIYTKRYKVQKSRKKVVNYKERISNFFGQGVNSMILTLSDTVLNVMFINIFIDWLFRLILIVYCIDSYLKTKSYVFMIPLAAEIFSRVLFFITLIKMSLDEKRQVSEAYQRAVQGKTKKQIDNDRLFLRQWTHKNIFNIVLRAMIPPELYFWQLQKQRKKMYYVLNMVYKGIQFVTVLGALTVVMLMEVLNDKVNYHRRLFGFSIILEEVSRYVINYLIINTFSQ